MESIVYVGMDVHKDTFSLCSYVKEKELFLGETTIDSKADLIKKYLDEIEKFLAGTKVKVKKFITAYEAGCLGFSLYKELTKLGIECKIIAPTTLAREPGSSVKKTDKKDAKMLARNLAFGTCSFVHIPDDIDQETRELIRMRNSHKKSFKKIKQNILQFCLRNGFKYEMNTYWTDNHLKWLKELQLNQTLKFVLDEYLDTFYKYQEKLERLDEVLLKRSDTERYKNDTDKLSCLKGITKQSSLVIISEIGDFHRFATPSEFCSYLGLVPGENSSGEKINHLGITKQGNSIVRTQLIESSQAIVRGAIGFKSKRLKARQLGKNIEVIRYADKASERLQRRYYSLTKRLLHHNKAIGAVARELACFIWGIMTDNLTITLRNI